MRELYGDDYESVADASARLIPEGARRLAGAAMFVAVIAAMGLWAYRLGTRDATEVPIIRAMEGPTRVQPADPGGLQAAHQGLEVNAVLAGRPAPQPEPLTGSRIPEPAALSPEDGPQGELVIAAPAVIPETTTDLPMPEEEAPIGALAARAPAPLIPSADFGGAVATAAGPSVAMEGTSADVIAADVAADIAEVAGTEAVAPVAASRPKVRPANLVVARAEPVAAPVTPKATATASPVRSASAPGSSTAAAVQRVAATSPTPAASAAASARETTGVPRGSRMVQLGAFDNEAMTRQAWQRLVAQNPDLLGNKSLYVERMTANARVFYRLRVAGFSSADQTRVMCEALRGRKIDCIPVTVQ